MRKIDKKIESQLVKVLTDVCDVALKEIQGFEWLTHLVNYSNFPKSLKVICIFDTKHNLANFLANKELIGRVEALIQAKLLEMDVRVNKITQHIGYDNQELCDQEHGGNWAKRLA